MPPPNDPPDQPSSGSDAASERVVRAATEAVVRAYVPYSDFAMGAAVETDGGDVLAGAVVENVSLGLAMCAERVALFTSVAAGAGRPRRIALVSRRTDGQITFPCGACLQVALELGGPDVEVIAVATDGERATATVGELLPCGPHRSRPAGGY